MVSMPAVCVVMFPKYSSRLPPAVILVRYGSAFLGRMFTVYRGYVTVLCIGTSLCLIQSNTSMPLVSKNPWNNLPNSFSPDVVHRRQIDGSGCLLKSLYAANFFNSSSQMEPPAMAKCCNTSACDAPL